LRLPRFGGAAYAVNFDNWSGYREVGLEHRKGVFTPAEYNAILRCLHPDTHPTTGQKNEAFRLWHEHKLLLMSQKEDARQYQRLPTVEEMMSMAATKAGGRGSPKQ